MFKTSQSVTVSAAILLAGLGAAGCSAGASENPPAGEAVRCEIDVTSSAAVYGLGAVVHADRAVAGSYRFVVTGSGGAGSTHVSQGGGFNAGPGDDARLGRMMLAGGAKYDVRLDISAGGRDYHCAATVGGI
ncbi:MAG: hypothetical protein Kow0026_04960 [Oricola sp.]